MNSSKSIMDNKTELHRLVNQELKRLNKKLHEYSDSAPENAKDLPESCTLTEQLQMWYYLHNPTEQCVNDLLQILNNEGLGVPINIQYLQGESTSGDPHASAESKMRLVKSENCKDKNCAVIDLQAQQKKMNAQLKLMMEEVAKAKVRLDQNEGLKDRIINKNSEIFPIKTLDELIMFETSLDETNENVHVLSLKAIIQNEEMKISLKRIILEKILLEHNYDGRFNKKAIKAYPKFLNVLFRAYEDVHGSQSDFTQNLKIAMKRAKNKHHKMNWEKKQRNKYKNESIKPATDDMIDDEDDGDEVEDDEYFN